MSFINKSKNKFVPKAKVRPRGGGAASAPAPAPTVSAAATAASPQSPSKFIVATPASIEANRDKDTSASAASSQSPLPTSSPRSATPNVPPAASSERPPKAAAPDVVPTPSTQTDQDAAENHEDRQEGAAPTGMNTSGSGRGRAASKGAVAPIPTARPARPVSDAETIPIPGAARDRTPMRDNTISTPTRRSPKTPVQDKTIPVPTRRSPKAPVQTIPIPTRRSPRTTDTGHITSVPTTRRSPRRPPAPVVETEDNGDEVVLEATQPEVSEGIYEHGTGGNVDDNTGGNAEVPDTSETPKSTWKERVTRAKAKTAKEGEAQKRKAPPPTKVSGHAKRRRVQDAEVEDEADVQHRSQAQHEMGVAQDGDDADNVVPSDDDDVSEYEAEAEDAASSTKPKAKGKGKKKAAEKTSKPLSKRKAAPRKPREPGQRKSGRKRAESSSDAEDKTIDDSVMKMKDLCKDTLIGKKSKRYVELANTDWAQVAREQRAKKKELQARREAGEDVEEETLDQRLENSGRRNNTREAGQVQVRLVDGQIVIDEQSLHIDRHEGNPVHEEDMEIVVEDQHTRIVNSGTYSKRERGERWDAAATEKFFEALSMFGTDFDLLSRMFPGRTRRQLKNKYNLEERKHPERVTRALRTPIPIDLQEYSQVTATQFRDPQDFEAELQRLREEHEAEEESIKTRAAQMEQERQEQANAAMHAEENGGGLNPEPGKKSRKKKRTDVGSVPQQEEALGMSIEEYQEQWHRERTR